MTSNFQSQTSPVSSGIQYDPKGHHSNEKDYSSRFIQVANSNGDWFDQFVYLLRVYPQKFNGCNAYMDIPLCNPPPDIYKVYFSTLNQTWFVYQKYQVPNNNRFRGDLIINITKVTIPPMTGFCLIC